jgi:hypothetical protein
MIWSDESVRTATDGAVTVGVLGFHSVRGAVVGDCMLASLESCVSKINGLIDQII